MSASTVRDPCSIQDGRVGIRAERDTTLTPKKPKKMPRTKQVNYRLPRAMIRTVHDLAEARRDVEGGHPNASRIVREALERYLPTLDPATGFADGRATEAERDPAHSKAEILLIVPAGRTP